MAARKLYESQSFYQRHTLEIGALVLLFIVVAILKGVPIIFKLVAELLK